MLGQRVPWVPSKVYWFGVKFSYYAYTVSWTITTYRQRVNCSYSVAHNILNTFEIMEKCMGYH